MNRALYKSMGYSDFDLDRPMIGIANAWSRVVPGHYNLGLVSDYVKQGIFQAGGTPVEFGVIGACDGIAEGHEGMHYILPTRDLIANDVEMTWHFGKVNSIVFVEMIITPLELDQITGHLLKNQKNTYLRVHYLKTDSPLDERSWKRLGLRRRYKAQIMDGR